MTVECLDCGEALKIPLDADEGDTVTCKSCGCTFVIVALHPVEIDYTSTEGVEGEGEFDEDWLDDDLGGEEDEDW